MFQSCSSLIPDSTAQFWLVQPGVNVSLLSEWKRLKLRNSLIQRFNSAANTEFKSSSIVLWKRMAQIAKITSDGLHFNVETLKASNQVCVRES